ncbi:type 1 fimbrial protein [Xenorhabdus sp. 12]|uniref:Type 1 fimbrial protein n=2 Tax=Xenorhabdus santafensis TaxID=2582833 RepID=A0ABU4S876_9GAMM|nr:type 1 fimbrial protein [Xenorhabdus sp. 12]
MGVFGAQAQSPEGGAKLIDTRSDGKINFTGTVVEAPCSISPESIDQTINFGVLSNALLNKGGETSRPFKIVLTECDTDTAKKATITFSGVNYGDTEIAMSGDAENIAVRLAGLDGKITLGKPSKVFNLSQSTNELNFMAFAKKSELAGKEGKNVVPGRFEGLTTFTMQYQ